jgi:hypothetical protein
MKMNEGETQREKAQMKMGGTHIYMCLYVSVHVQDPHEPQFKAKMEAGRSPRKRSDIMLENNKMTEESMWEGK